MALLRAVRTVAPSVPVVTVEEFAAMAAVDAVGYYRAVIERMLSAATARIDGYHGILGRCMINQTWRADFDTWATDRKLRLPFPDVSSVTTVAYSDSENAEQTVVDTLYSLMSDSGGSYLTFTSGFTSPGLYTDRSDKVRVTFVAGYGAAAADVPADLSLAIIMLAAHWLENREGQGEIPPQVHSLLSRVWQIKV